MKQRQITLALSGLHVREAQDGSEESREIEGYAAVFNQRSVNLVPWNSYREVFEVLESGCMDAKLLRESDVVLTAFHDNTKILGRSTNGKGTLTLSLDEKGLKVRCTLPRTNTADDMLELIKRGDVSGMSFAYTTDEDDSQNCVSYEREAEKSADGKEVWVRHVKRITGLYDVTIAGHPAYPQTSVETREAGEEMLKHIEAPVQAQEDALKVREREAEKARHRKAKRLRQSY